MLGGHLERFIQVGTVEEIESRDGLGGLDTWTVVHEHLPAPHANGRRLVNGGKDFALQAHAAPLHLRDPSLDLGSDACPLLWAEPDRLVTANQHQQSH
jgi:hypothetical protein